jgi:hypothetical protein
VRSIRFAGLACALTFAAAAARAETTLCTDITSAPFVISSPGIYCLKNSISGMIQIQSSDVVLDLNGHVVASPTPGQGGGIVASDAANLTVRNGTVRGFSVGIQISGRASRGHLIERLKVTDNADTAIYVAGDGSVVRHNMLLNNGFNPAIGPRWVLYASGDGVHIADNQVVESGVGALYEVVGIRTDGSGVAVERNVVSNTVVGVHNSRGILVNGAATARNSVVGNRIVNMKIGIMNGFGSAGPAIFMDNTVGGATIAPFSFGVLAGSTNFSY